MEGTLEGSKGQPQALSAPPVASSTHVAAPTDPCARCRAPLGERFFQVNGDTYCVRCHDQLAGAFTDALAFGGLTAVLCVGLYHGIYWVLHMHFVFVSVMAGVLIGMAVRRGAHASRLLRYRWLSVLLTYLATVACYALSLLEKTQGHGPAMSAISALWLPLPMLTEGGNLVTLILFGFGLHEAWKFSAPPYVNVEGPFSTTASAPHAT